MTKILKDNHIGYYKNLAHDIELSVRRNSNGEYLFVFNNSNEPKVFESKATCDSILNYNIKGKKFNLKPYEVEIFKVSSRAE